MKYASNYIVHNARNYVITAALFFANSLKTSDKQCTLNKH